MGFEGFESCLVVQVVVVVQLGNYRAGTNAVGGGSLERDVAAANEWAQNQDQDFPRWLLSRSRRSGSAAGVRVAGRHPRLPAGTDV